ncbi:hydrogenase 3 maturation endopeptidase HyCI [Candidatus Poribacteria bacterium]|nr:hydrogenase 3 maturation endopeptidase HyCI [Candidatus Poribacteria bacterium]
MIELLKSRLKGKVLILGVGNPLRGDDGAGPHLIEQLNGKIDADLLDCGEVPENFLGKIVQLHPNTILIIETVHLGASPGAVAIIEADDIDRVSYSTHHASLRLSMNYLKNEIGAEVFVLGIQPKKTEFSMEVSDEVKETLAILKNILVNRHAHIV